jgi:predicted amidohydrolase
MFVTLIQARLTWENPQVNRAYFSEKIAGIQEQTDLIVLPEMFSTGFSMSPETLAEPMDGPTMQWLAEQAKDRQAAITGSFIAQENGHYYNRLIWMQPDGQYHTYDKKHLFTLAGEHNHYTPGQQHLVVEWKGWRILPLICYDLRFPVWSRNTQQYDLLRVPSKIRLTPLASIVWVPTERAFNTQAIPSCTILRVRYSTGYRIPRMCTPLNFRRKIRISFAKNLRSCKMLTSFTLPNKARIDVLDGFDFGQ